MANEIRRRYNFLSGRITDNPLTNSATTLNSAELAGLAAIGSTEHAVLVLDPTGVGNGPEVVYVTAHTGSATSATITRGREGTSGVQHASTIYWVHVATRADFDLIGASGEEPSGGGLPYEGEKFTDTTNDRIEHYSGSAWQRTGWYSASGRTGGQWTRSTNLTITTASYQDVTWSTEVTDSDGFLAPTSASLTVPAGLGGLYAYDFNFTWSGDPASQAYQITKNGTVWHNLPLATSGTPVGASGMIVLAAADVVKLRVIQTSAGSLNINPATFNLYRLAI